MKCIKCGNNAMHVFKDKCGLRIEVCENCNMVWPPINHLKHAGIKIPKLLLATVA